MFSDLATLLVGFIAGGLCGIVAMALLVAGRRAEVDFTDVEKGRTTLDQMRAAGIGTPKD